MAASDQFYRNQKTMDIVFGVSCILMLGSIVWMFAQDYYRPFKTEQRVFRDVEVSMNQYQAILSLPDVEEIEEAESELAAKLAERKEKDQKVQDLQKQIDERKPQRDKAEARFQDIKAQLDSKASFYDIEVEKHGPTSDYAKALKKEINDLKGKLSEVQAERDNVVMELLQLQRQRDAFEEPVTKALTKVNKLYEKFDSLIAAAQKKEWSIYDSIRAMPVLDGFASPLKIHQFTINDVPIDYNFKYVTRFDRCMTCHLAIEKQVYSKETLKLLRTPDEHDLKGQKHINDLQVKLGKAQKLLEKRKKVLEGLPEAAKLPDPSKLTFNTLSKDYLTDARITEFCGHPRLDLFVGPNSKHPAEKYGCTSCHSGQGSATDFYNATHSPNNSAQQKQWKQEHGWASNHFWDFPMLPKRFVESSCVKCHHEITDLITSENKVEAPKLVKGYNLVMDLGCFGCHEISGLKNGKKIGPDLRLEPNPPLDKMPPEEREKLLADKENPPGTLAKVGPSLYRIAEKTNKDWTVKWLSSPSSFRPDTKMPHFYNLSNNSKAVLPEYMMAFPDTEMQAITHYLFKTSKQYLKNVEQHHGDTINERLKDENLVKAMTTQVNLPEMLKQATSLEAYKVLKGKKPQDRTAEGDKLLAAEKDEAKKKKLKQALDMLKFVFDVTQTVGLNDKDVAELELNPAAFLQQAKNRIAWRDAAPPVEAAGAFTELIGKHKSDPDRGRVLFSERGCLACHHHEGTMKEDKDKKIPALPSVADFGPDLSQVKEKLGASHGDKKSATLWLANWIKNPQAHSPRSTMPKVPLKDDEILDITAWLLDQPADKSVGHDWANTHVDMPNDQKFYDLANVYLQRLLSKADLAKLKALETAAGKRVLDSTAIGDLPEDERNLVKDYTFENVKTYVGKKAVGRLGCFACHNIPGFDDTKSIGVNLNDWGKKDPNRLAFENIGAYVEHHFFLVDQMTIKSGAKAGHAQPFKHGDDGHGHSHGGAHGLSAVKKPYEKYFADGLAHHNRIGYLHQKLLEPRSYDYERDRAWDDLARMPKFKFARPTQRDGESDTDFAARAWKEEAEAREAVMTFVLGLVAEPLPDPVVHQPKGPRLDEVKGRKVLEKFNCAGCHLIQPGIYETPNNAKSLDLFTKSFADQKGLEKDFDFLNHHVWAGKTPKTGQEKLKAFGLTMTDTAGKLVLSKESLALQLTGALRFADMYGALHDIRGGGQTKLSPSQMIYPPPQAFQKLQTALEAWQKADEAGDAKLTTTMENRFNDALREFQGSYGSYGGTFANLLPYFLAGRAEMGAPGMLKEVYGGRDTTTDRIVPKNLALAASPPWLIGEGERTQPEWLYQFLLNPQPIRKLAVLKMPHFNLSDEEAKALVKYFGAVERLTNPKNELVEAYTKIPQQSAAFDEPYWKKKNQDYVKRLKSTNANEKKTHYEMRVEELKPVWKKIEAASKDQLGKAESQLDGIVKELKAQSIPDPILQDAEKVWGDEVKRLKDLVKNSDPAMQQQQWEESDAYIADSFRLLANKNLCAKCHQVGNMLPAGKESEGHGPPLSTAPKRLKPKWITHWIANPPRMIHYSPMPQYFSKDVKDKQNLFVGDSMDQIQAVTDALMIYDRAVDMPINRYWTLLPVSPPKKE